MVFELTANTPSTQVHTQHWQQYQRSYQQCPMKITQGLQVDVEAHAYIEQHAHILEELKIMIVAAV